MRMKSIEPESKESAVRPARHQIAPADKERTGLASSLLHLQRAHGNRYVQRLLNATLQRSCGCGGTCSDCASKDRDAIQTRLAVSQPGDQYEQEADRVAEQVMRMQAPTTLEESATSHFPAISRYAQRQAVARQEETEEEEVSESDLLSLKEVPGASHDLSADLEARIESLRGGGHEMSSDLRAFFEPRFGRDFSSVRLHTDSSAGETAQRLNARAFTLGRDIAFAPGEYQPETTEGRRLLAHELTHVVQQNDSSVRTLMRVCSCSAIGARDPTAAENTFLTGKFPYLVSGNWCVSAPATPTYNCYAWSIGNTTKWIDKEVDSVYGDNDGALEFSDFDEFYSVEGALTPVTNATPADPEVVLYGKGGKPTHAAAKSSTPCGFATVESKLGKYLRIIHNARELEGGSVYGDIDRYYVT
ncbi:MAG: DUF4157 domain-containing protein [Acidobacteriota bacterium]